MQKYIFALTAMSLVSIGSISYANVGSNVSTLRQKSRMVCVCKQGTLCKCTKVNKSSDGTVVY